MDHQQQGTQHPRGANHPTVTTHPKGEGSEDVNQWDMTQHQGVQTTQ